MNKKFSKKQLKLIKLFNEFLNDWQDWQFCDRMLDENEDLYDSFFHTQNWEWTIELEQVIWLRFWFIKWLCENDRLNWNNDKYAIILYENWTRKFIADYEELIMELSIKIHPLDYLVSLIK